MTMTYDAVADAVYIYLKEIAPGEVKGGGTLLTDRDDVSVNLDYDENGFLIGIELLGARKLVHPAALKTAGAT